VEEEVFDDCEEGPSSLLSPIKIIEGEEGPSTKFGILTPTRGAGTVSIEGIGAETRSMAEIDEVTFISSNNQGNSGTSCEDAGGVLTAPVEDEDSVMDKNVDEFQIQSDVGEGDGQSEGEGQLNAKENEGQLDARGNEGQLGAGKEEGKLRDARELAAGESERLLIEENAGASQSGAKNDGEDGPINTDPSTLEEGWNVQERSVQTTVDYSKSVAYVDAVSESVTSVAFSMNQQYDMKEKGEKLAAESEEKESNEKIGIPDEQSGAEHRCGEFENKEWPLENQRDSAGSGSSVSTAMGKEILNDQVFKNDEKETYQEETVVEGIQLETERDWQLAEVADALATSGHESSKSDQTAVHFPGELTVTTSSEGTESASQPCIVLQPNIYARRRHLKENVHNCEAALDSKNSTVISGDQLDKSVGPDRQSESRMHTENDKREQSKQDEKKEVGINRRQGGKEKKKQYLTKELAKDRKKLVEVLQQMLEAKEREEKMKLEQQTEKDKQTNVKDLESQQSTAIQSVEAESYREGEYYGDCYEGAVYDPESGQYYYPEQEYYQGEDGQYHAYYPDQGYIEQAEGVVDQGDHTNLQYAGKEGDQTFSGDQNQVVKPEHQAQEEVMQRDPKQKCTSNEQQYVDLEQQEYSRDPGQSYSEQYADPSNPEQYYGEHDGLGQQFRGRSDHNQRYADSNQQYVDSNDPSQQYTNQDQNYGYQDSNQQYSSWGKGEYYEEKQHYDQSGFESYNQNQQMEEERRYYKDYKSDYQPVVSSLPLDETNTIVSHQVKSSSQQGGSESSPNKAISMVSPLQPLTDLAASPEQGSAMISAQSAQMTGERRPLYESASEANLHPPQSQQISPLIQPRYQGPPPEHQGPLPGHQGPLPGHQGPLPGHQGPPPGHQGPPPGYQGPPPVHQGPPPGHQGSPPEHQGLPPEHQGPPPGHQGPPPGHYQGPPPRHQGPPPGHQGPLPGHQGPPPGHQGPPPGHQGPPPGHQGPPPGHQGPPPGHQGPPPGHQGPPPGHQDPLPRHQDSLENHHPPFQNDHPPFQGDYSPFQGKRPPLLGERPPFSSDSPPPPPGDNSTFSANHPKQPPGSHSFSSGQPSIPAHQASLHYAHSSHQQGLYPGHQAASANHPSSFSSHQEPPASLHESSHLPDSQDVKSLSSHAPVPPHHTQWQSPAQGYQHQPSGKMDHPLRHSQQTLSPVGPQDIVQSGSLSPVSQPHNQPLSSSLSGHHKHSSRGDSSDWDRTRHLSRESQERRWSSFEREDRFRRDKNQPVGDDKYHRQFQAREDSLSRWSGDRKRDTSRRYRYSLVNEDRHGDNIYMSRNDGRKERFAGGSSKSTTDALKDPQSKSDSNRPRSPQHYTKSVKYKAALSYVEKRNSMLRVSAKSKESDKDRGPTLVQPHAEEPPLASYKKSSDSSHSTTTKKLLSQFKIPKKKGPTTVSAGLSHAKSNSNALAPDVHNKTAVNSKQKDSSREDSLTKDVVSKKQGTKGTDEMKNNDNVSRGSKLDSLKEDSQIKEVVSIQADKDTNREKVDNLTFKKEDQNEKVDSTDLVGKRNREEKKLHLAKELPTVETTTHGKILDADCGSAGTSVATASSTMPGSPKGLKKAKHHVAAASVEIPKAAAVDLNQIGVTPSNKISVDSSKSGRSLVVIIPTGTISSTANISLPYSVTPTSNSNSVVLAIASTVAHSSSTLTSTCTTPSMSTTRSKNSTAPTSDDPALKLSTKSIKKSKDSSKWKGKNVKKTVTSTAEKVMVSTVEGNVSSSEENVSTKDRKNPKTKPILGGGSSTKKVSVLGSVSSAKAISHDWSGMLQRLDPTLVQALAATVQQTLKVRNYLNVIPS